MAKRVAIINALPKESALFFELPGDAPKLSYGIEWAKRKYHGVELTIACAGMGTTNTAQATQFLIDRAEPELIIFSGIAGSLNPALDMDDVVLGKSLVCLEADMDVIAECAPYLTRFSSAAWALDAAEAVLNEMNFEKVASLADDTPLPETRNSRRYCRGCIATSNLFSTEAEVLESIRKTYSADCEEMEGAAAAQVAARAGIDFLAIRSISNVCGEAYEALDDRQDDLVRCARLAAEVALGVVERVAGD